MRLMQGVHDTIWSDKPQEFVCMFLSRETWQWQHRSPSNTKAVAPEKLQVDGPSVTRAICKGHFVPWCGALPHPLHSVITK